MLAGERRLTHAAAGQRMGCAQGLALLPREQGVSSGMGSAQPDARPAGAGAVPGPPENRRRYRRPALGHAGLGRPRSPEPLAPFWVSAGVIDGRVEPDAAPLVRLAAEGGAVLSGLRLDDGTLMLRIEQPGRSMQVRFPAGSVFLEDGGLRLVVERDVARIEDVWSGLPVPRRGRARGTASFCWRWRARRKGSRSARSRAALGRRAGRARLVGRTAGCGRASSADAGAAGRY